MNESTDRTLRIYMPFSLPIDPANMFSITDLEISYALSGRLVQFDQTKQIVSGIASRWSVDDSNVVTFYLREDGKWSDGSAIEAVQVVASFDRAKLKYGERLKGLFDIVKSITSDNNSVKFSLADGISVNAFLTKLTEPMYGVTKSVGSELDLSVSCGPFIVKDLSESNLTLMRNPHFHDTSTLMPETIQIRKSGQRNLQTVLLDEEWANISESTSLMTAELKATYEKDETIKLWTRPLDRVFMFMLSDRAAGAEGFALMRFLASHLDRDSLLSGISGYTLADQLFPRGYLLNDPDFTKSVGKQTLPIKYGASPLKVLYCPVRTPEYLIVNIKKAIESATGQQPILVSAPLSELMSKFTEGDFDIYAGPIGTGDSNPDGSISYLFEFDIPVVRSDESSHLGSLAEARKETDEFKRIDKYRKLLSTATSEGRVLPIFHYSTVTIARKNIDLSQIPDSDESLSFNKIKMLGK